MRSLSQLVLLEAGLAATRGDYRSDPVAIRLWRPLAEQGDVLAQYVIGRAYRDLGEVRKALKWYRRAAERGNLEAQSRLAGMYASSDSVPRDDVTAAKWYRIAAERGDASSENSLKLLYDRTRSLPQGEPERIEWFRNAVSTPE